MREIKFRAWDGKEMKLAFDLSQNPKYWWEGNKDFPLMQYTGLKDSDKTEIYEGDILVIKGELYPFEIAEKAVVIFADGSFLLENLKKDDGNYLFNVIESCFTEVIGNIYDNPELLEVQP